MSDWSVRRECLDCPHGGHVDPGVQHVRCERCRRDHRTAKAADAQWDRRARKRAEAAARRAARGNAPIEDPQVRPRQRTPTWDQFGRETAGTARLTPAEMQALRASVQRLEGALREVKWALDPRR